MRTEPSRETALGLRFFPSLVADVHLSGPSQLVIMNKSSFYSGSKNGQIIVFHCSVVDGLGAVISWCLCRVGIDGSRKIVEAALEALSASKPGATQPIHGTVVRFDSWVLP